MTTSPERYILFPTMLAVLGMALAWLAATTGQVERQKRQYAELELAASRARAALLQAQLKTSATNVPEGEIEKLEQQVAEAERKVREAPPLTPVFGGFG